MATTVARLLLRSPASNAVLWSRYVSVSASRRTFDVKDVKDFHERVIKASTPVIVDFHAEYVCMFVCLYVYTPISSC